MSSENENDNSAPQAPLPESGEETPVTASEEGVAEASSDEKSKAKPKKAVPKAGAAKAKVAKKLDEPSLGDSPSVDTVNELGAVADAPPQVTAEAPQPEKVEAAEAIVAQKPSLETPPTAKEAEPSPVTETAEKPVVAKEAPPAKDAVAKAPPEKKEVPPPAPPEPGPFGQFLSGKGISTEPLGPDAGGLEMIRVASADLLAVVQRLRDDGETKFDLLVSVAGVDWKTHREVVYHLFSTYTHKTVALKVVAEDDKLPSVVSIWQTADWHERETFDLYGIVFEGHPNLSRILMPQDWIGYPMRKDYEVTDARLVWNER